MDRTFIYFKVFEKRWEELGLNDNDLTALERFILSNPEAGDMIQGTGGLRKLRYSLPDRGKSGGVRVLYVDFATFEQTIFINVYAKGKQDTLTHNEKKMYRSIINEMLEDLRK